MVSKFTTWSQIRGGSVPTINAPANTTALTATCSVTGANTTPLINLTSTWNTTGIARGLLLNITDTASAATSRLLDLGVGSRTQYALTKSRQFWIFNSSPATQDASNFERGFMRWNSDVLEIGTEAGGTGAGRFIRLISAQPNPAHTIFFELGFSGSPYFSVQSQTAPRVVAAIAGELHGRAALGIDLSLNAYLSFGPGSGARDIFLMRNAAAAFEVNNGTLGTFRDMKLRNVIQASGITTTVTPPSNGDLVIQQTSNTSITFKMRGTDGTVRSASLTLA